jgi:hypothetical protein
MDWSELEDVNMICVDEVKDFYTVCDDGNFEAKPMKVHLRKVKTFCLYYIRKGQDYHSTLMEDDVLDMSKAEFKHYCGSKDYFTDVVNGSLPVMTQKNTRAHANTGGIADATDLLTAQEFQLGVKRDKAHYAGLKDVKYFRTWIRGFVATARLA